MNTATATSLPDRQILTEEFRCTFTGRIEESEDGLILICTDDTRLRISSEPSECSDGLQRWHVIPTTDSTSELSGVRVLAHEPLEGDLEDRCEFAGRVVQISSRQQLVMFKVSVSEKKPFKITLLGSPELVKVNQLFWVRAIRVGMSLQIQQVQCLETFSSPSPAVASDAHPTAAPKAAPAPTLNETQIAQELAHQALFEETCFEGWKLAEPLRRKHVWEWEAVLPSAPVPTRARVRVSTRTQQTEVYQYKNTPQRPLGEDLAGHLAVTPLGAARSIGASCFLVEIGPYEIVLDCGTRPKGWEPLPALEYITDPDLLLVSHAHQDHIGAVPVFHNRFPGTRMICTGGTREIAHVMLRDCLKVQQSNEDFPDLFDEADLDRSLFRLETQEIGIDFEPLPGLKVRFINAGHIVGAACIYLRYGERSLLYTGDYNTTSSRTTEGLQLRDLPHADMLITESTYGAVLHPARKEQERELLHAIAHVVQQGGNVLIPAFALGRAQEIMLAIRTSALFHKLQIPVYVDGLVRAVTDVFRDNLEFLPSSVQNFAQQQEPFFSETGVPTIIPIASPKERPLAIAKPSVIVASSGMLTGGPSVYYASILLERENAAIFISGYTDEESPWRMLQNLNRGDTITLEGKQITVQAQVKRFNLSAHADRTGLGQAINAVNPKHLILIHGSKEALHELARAGDLQQKHLVHIPAVGERISYDSAPAHLSESQGEYLKKAVTERRNKPPEKKSKAKFFVSDVDPDVEVGVEPWEEVIASLDALDTRVASLEDQLEEMQESLQRIEALLVERSRTVVVTDTTVEAQFLAAVFPQGEKRVPASDLYQSYTDWCENKGCKPHTRQKFIAAIQVLGCDRSKKLHGNFYYCIPPQDSACPPLEEIN